MTGEQVLLLPRVDYFKWVAAVQKYALHFGVGITPDPLKAGNYENVTVVIPPQGYPHEGNIEVWLRRKYPNVRIDSVHVASAERLAQVLAGRVQAKQRYGKPVPKGGAARERNTFSKDRLYLFWPTDYTTIEQHFGAHPEIYSSYGLAGHDGVDIRAPKDANVYACADGEVYMVEDEEGHHNYGKHVRIQHSNGYRTVYANLKDVVVAVGDHVEARQVIGTAGGNGENTNLHLSLKKDEATQRGETNYPGDLIDPTPFLVFPHLEPLVRKTLGLPESEAEGASYPWARGCLVGLGGRVGGAMQDADFEVIAEAKIEAVRIERDTPTRTILRLREINDEMFLMAELFYLPEDGEWSAEGWLEAVRPELHRLYADNVRYFGIQRLPNVSQFGWNRFWHSGERFASWWLEVYQALREDYPEARFGFPGVLPGGQVAGRRLDAQVFLDGADPALMAADWLGVVCYWENEAGREAQSGGRFYEVLRERYPEKLLFITEFGNTSLGVKAAARGQEYLSYYQELKQAAGIGAAFAQVVSAASGYDALVWRSEAGAANEVVGVVGGR